MAVEARQRCRASENIEPLLPRLLYVGDVPVESSYHGSALLYRLLQSYPCERLLIVESLLRSSVERRLPDVRYVEFRIGNRRLLHTRFAAWYSSWLAVTAAGRINRIDSAREDFQPAAVLTVAHGYSWITAARFAATQCLPLHLICHDDWPRFTNVISAMKDRIDTIFASVYRQAASRLCVSPFMRNAYRERYNVEGRLLYPSRGVECPEYLEPPDRIRKRSSGLTVAFGGTVNSDGYLRNLASVAFILHRMGGRLLIFGPLGSDDGRRGRLDLPNVEIRGLIKSREMLGRFRDEVDVLLVPMSFDASDRSNTEMNFPSKLADYTAVGLPLLIYGPAYSSAVRWARENYGVAEVVDAENTKWLSQAIHRLATNPAHRAALGARALEVGREYFTLQAAQSVFHDALREHWSRLD